MAFSTWSNQEVIIISILKFLLKQWGAASAGWQYWSWMKNVSFSFEKNFACQKKLHLAVMAPHLFTAIL